MQGRVHAINTIYSLCSKMYVAGEYVPTRWKWANGPLCPQFKLWICPSSSSAASTSASAPALHLRLRGSATSPPPPRSSPTPGAPPGPRAPRWCSAAARWWRRGADLLPAAGGGELVLCCRPLVEASCCLRAPRGCSSPCTGAAAAEVLAAGQELL